MKKHVYLITCIIISAGLLLSGCSKEDDEQSIARVDTYAITPTFLYGKYLVNHPYYEITLENFWGSGGVTFHVYVIQGNTFTDIGNLHTTETSIAAADKKKPVHIDVPIPASIDVSKPYKIVAADKSTNPVLSSNKIVFEVDLKRDDSYCPGWYVAQGGSSATSQSNYLITYEAVYVTNNTNKPIKVKLLGFDAMDKWYSKKGKVSINTSLDVETSVVSSSGEATSEKVSINEGDGGYIVSTYVPTGKKMMNARLILEIDGKEVKTPIVSSDISIENGTYYRMDVKWDGTNLEWD